MPSNAADLGAGRRAQPVARVALRVVVQYLGQGFLAQLGRQCLDDREQNVVRLSHGFTPSRPDAEVRERRGATTADRLFSSFSDFLISMESVVALAAPT